MGAAAAIPDGLAARRQRLDMPRSLFGTRAARISSLLLVILAGIVVVSGAVGYALVLGDDRRLEAERHDALRSALNELHAVLGNADHFDKAQLQLIGQRAGLQDLHFDSDPIGDAGREAQSLHDGQGRIVGWFSWKPDRSLFRTMERMWTLVGLVGVVLAACAFLALLVTRKLAGSLTRSLEYVHKLTSEDALTRLPNHRTMQDRLNAAVAARRSGAVTFALIDLDNFREVNDALGRTGGDAVFATIAEHLKAGLPAGALFGRFEDDEFAVVLTSDRVDPATALTDAISAALSRPVFLDRMWQITACVGIAEAPQDATTGEELARRAGLALCAAKTEGRAIARRFEQRIETEYSERSFLLRELKAAISSRSFDVAYQPVVAADGGGILGVEALLRWQHPTRGAIPPSDFIPLAEQNGLMPRLGEIVLRRALADGTRWPNLFVAVNLSPLQISDRGLVDLVGAVMAETAISSSHVVLEVTEGVFIDNPLETQDRLDALRRFGVRIALDDFGTGYSSLSYLQKFPFDRLKIDRAFVASLGTTGNAGAIVQSIVTLGHALGMKVLAEGVETDEQRVLLRLAGCDEMQGFLFAKPMPADGIDKVLNEPAKVRARAAKQAAASAS
jgi:diguanylate cyclase (GGDEF)-like protein